MDKDNEIYVTSNGELYKKGVKQAINPQTNYTTQRFYTKEEYERLQAENEELRQIRKDIPDIQQPYVIMYRNLKKELHNLQAENDNLKDDIDKQQLYVDSLEQENERLKKLKFKSDGIELLQDANLNLHNANVKYRLALQEIRYIINAPCDNCKYNKDGITCSIGDCGEGKLRIIENKINEVIGANQ